MELLILPNLFRAKMHLQSVDTNKHSSGGVFHARFCIGTTKTLAVMLIMSQDRKHLFLSLTDTHAIVLLVGLWQSIFWKYIFQNAKVCSTVTTAS